MEFSKWKLEIIPYSRIHIFFHGRNGINVFVRKLFIVATTVGATPSESTIDCFRRIPILETKTRCNSAW